MNLIDPDPIRAFRTVAVGVLVRIANEEAEKRREDAAGEKPRDQCEQPVVGEPADHAATASAGRLM